MLLKIVRCSSWCSKLNSKDICCCAANHSVTNFPDWPPYIFLENNLLEDQNISLIVIFLIVLITFPFDDVVMLLGENRCWSLKGRGERAYQRGYTRGGGVAYKSGGTPSPTWSVLHPGGSPLLIPLSSIGDMSLTTGDCCQDFCPGWLPLVPLDLVFLPEGLLSWSPYP